MKIRGGNIPWGKLPRMIFLYADHTQSFIVVRWPWCPFNTHLRMQEPSRSSAHCVSCFWGLFTSPCPAHRTITSIPAAHRLPLLPMSCVSSSRISYQFKTMRECAGLALAGAGAAGGAEGSQAGSVGRPVCATRQVGGNGLRGQDPEAVGAGRRQLPAHLRGAHCLRAEGWLPVGWLAGRSKGRLVGRTYQPGRKE